MIFRRKSSHGEINIIDAAILGFIAFGFMCLLLIFVQNRHEKGLSPRIQCLNNQKQLIVGFLVWANNLDTNEAAIAFPMELPVENGGTKGSRFQNDIAANFLVLSNELTNPRVLVCPFDKSRKPAKTFSEIKLQNVSYFLNLGAKHGRMEEVILGDRSITFNGRAVRGYLETTNAAAFGWTNWSHKDGGNVALGDGSAHQVNDRLLRQLLTNSLPGPIRLIVP